MGMIQVSAVFQAIPPSNLAEFEQVIGQLVERSKAEPDTLRYDTYFTADRSTCAVHETYADAAAMVRHLDDVGPLVQQLLALCGGVQSQLFGRPSDALAKAIAGFGITEFTHFKSK